MSFLTKSVDSSGPCVGCATNDNSVTDRNHCFGCFRARQHRGAMIVVGANVAGGWIQV